MIIENEFDFGEIVYLKTDINQLPRMVVAIQKGADGGIVYKCAQGPNEFWHYEIEITRDRNTTLCMTFDS